MIARYLCDRNFNAALRTSTADVAGKVIAASLAMAGSCAATNSDGQDDDGQLSQYENHPMRQVNSEEIGPDIDAQNQSIYIFGGSRKDVPARMRQYIGSSMRFPLGVHHYQETSTRNAKPRVTVAIVPHQRSVIRPHKGHHEKDRNHGADPDENPVGPRSSHHLPHCSGWRGRRRTCLHTGRGADILAALRTPSADVGSRLAAAFLLSKIGLTSRLYIL